MRVAVVDIGSNSARLLVADVEQGRLTQLERRTTVTRLGQDVDHTGALREDAIDRVMAVLAEYRTVIDGLGASRAVAVLTSAVRDAADGEAFRDAVAARHDLDARVLSGDEEARLTFLGATSERAPSGVPVAVIDIGGGSTEIVAGTGAAVTFAVSTQAGVVRQTERHLRHDPPEPGELQALTDEARATFGDALPADVRDTVGDAIAVAGTATSCAAIALELEPYDPAVVHGHRLSLAELEALTARLAGMSLPERRALPGLHPDRAGVIVAGVVLLVEALRCLGVDDVEVSEHDILRGTALAVAREP